MFHVRRAVVLFGGVLVLVALSAPSCGGKSAMQIADDAGRAWLNKGDTSALSQLPRDLGQLGDDAARSSMTSEIDEVARTKPSQQEIQAMSPEVRQQVEALSTKVAARQSYYSNVTTQIASARSAQASLPEAAVSAVKGSMLRSLKPEAEDYVTDEAKEILLEVACDLLWQGMFPDEQDVVRKSVEVDKKYETTYASRVDNIVNAAPQAILTAIVNAGVRSYRARYNDPEVMNWTSYAQDLAEKAQTVAEHADDIIKDGDVGIYTVGLVAFAVMCLK